MSNFELQEKAVKAATRFIERKGFELLEAGWTSPEGTQIDLIANDEDTLVFIDVTATEYGEGGASRAARSSAATLRSRQRPGSQATRPTVTSRSASTSSTCWS